MSHAFSIHVYTEVICYWSQKADLGCNRNYIKLFITAKHNHKPLAIQNY